MRSLYLKTCLALERQTFQQVQKYGAKIEPIDHLDHSTSIRVPTLSRKQQSSVSWHDEFQKLFQLGLRRQILSNILIHGSHGDFTTTNYSDLDFTVVLTPSVLTEQATFRHYREWLCQMYRLLYQIDPLQHHGPFYLWPKLIGTYSNSILPLVAYDDAWAMQPFAEVFKLNPTPERFDRTPMAIQLCRNLIHSQKLLFRFGYNRFAMKRYLSYAMLIPAYYYTDIGTPKKKADSFEAFYSEFGIASKPIRIATALRAEWPQETPWLTRSKKLFAFNKVTRRAICLLDKKRNTQQTIVQEIQPLVAKLTEAIEAKLCTKS